MTTQIEKLAALWTLGSWSVGHTKGTSKGYNAIVHGYGTCAFGYGETPEAAFNEAILKFRQEYPDELTAKRERLQKSIEETARLQAELDGVA